MDQVQLGCFFLLCLPFCVTFVFSLECNNHLCGYGTYQDTCSNGINVTCRCPKDAIRQTHYNKYNQDVDICQDRCGETLTCPNNYKCSSMLSVCICDQGYALSFAGQCVDINECTDGKICDDKNNTVCSNTDGSFVCECLEGYTYSRGFNTSCYDIKECQDDKICDDKANTVCVNTIGSFVCECLEGYTYSRGFNTSCHDIDECQNAKICDDTVCVNTIGSFMCECASGYNKSNSNSSCHDVDECVDYPPVCGDHSICLNHPGNYTCRCLGGYSLSADRNSACVPVSPAESSDPNAEIRAGVGLYVGVTFGVLALLSLSITVFFLSRRINSKKTETAKCTQGINDCQTKGSKDYEDVDQEQYECPVVITLKHDARTNLEDYLNPKFYQTEFDTSTNSNSCGLYDDIMTESSDGTERESVSTESTPSTNIRSERSKATSVSACPHYEELFADDSNAIDTMSKLSKPRTPHSADLLDEPEEKNTLDVIYLNTNQDKSKTQMRSHEDRNVDYCTLQLGGDNKIDEDQHAYRCLFLSDKNSKF